MRVAAVLLSALVLLVAASASAHETLHEVKHGNAIAVRAYFTDGEVLAYTACEIYSPADPKIPYQKGRTDREGWVAFVPNSPGKWRVKIIDDTGHGLDIEVEASPGAGVATATEEGTAIGSIAFVLRPLLGLAVIGAVFAALFNYYRRKGISQ